MKLSVPDDPYRRALFLWLAFKTQSSAYKAIADGLELTTHQLNSICHTTYRKRMDEQHRRKSALRNN